MTDAAFERGVLRHLTPVVGQTLAKIGGAHGVAAPKGRVPKNYAAVVVRRMLEAGGAQSDQYQFGLRRIPIKTVRVAPDLRPFEKMSFRAFRQDELLKETWLTSSLRSDISRLFFVVLRAPRETTPIPQYTLFRAFFWSPTEGQMFDIRREWEVNLTHIRRHGAVNLPRESGTNYIHIRPHGRDSDDMDPTARVPATRKSFWFNREFLAAIVRKGR